MPAAIFLNLQEELQTGVSKGPHFPLRYVEYINPEFAFVQNSTHCPHSGPSRWHEACRFHISRSQAAHPESFIHALTWRQNSALQLQIVGPRISLSLGYRSICVINRSWVMRNCERLPTQWVPRHEVKSRDKRDR